MDVNKRASPIAAAFFSGVLICLLLTSCRRGETIEQENLVYKAGDVFGAQTREHSLAVAAARGDVPEIKRLINARVNINAVGRHEITPLWWAVFAGNYDGFAVLLDNGANPNAQRSEGDPVMLLATEQKDPRFLAAALKHSGNPNFRDSNSGKTPLFPAVLRGYKPQIEMLLAAGADPNARMPYSGETLPMVAIGARVDYELAYELFQKGADPAAKLKSGQTLADWIEVRSVTAANNDDPWRKKVIEYLQSKGVVARH